MADQSLYEDWFWKPLKRFEVKFTPTKEEGNAWRESGLRLQIANRISSQLDSKQARLAYLYDGKEDRKNSRQELSKRKKGRYK